ncbi:MAG: hypothetical protein R3Y11_01255 [Pseudomonadota bacterium]
MQKQQYTLLLMRDDGVNRNIRFCANTLRLLVALCIIIPVVMLASIYMASQYWQNAAIMAHTNEELRHELHVYQQELQKYTTIQRLVKDYEHEASPILMASQAVPAAVPYAVEEAPTSGDTTKDGVAVTGAEVTKIDSTESDASGQNTGQRADHSADHSAAQNAGNASPVAMADDAETMPSRVSGTKDSPTSTNSVELAQKDASGNASTDASANTQNSSQTVAEAPKKPSIEEILQQQNRPQGADHESFTVVTDKKAKLTDLAIRENKGQVKTSFQLVNTTDAAIAGHIYIAIQGHDKQLHPISISEKYTAFRIMRFRDYDLSFALPSGFSAADVDKVVITAKTRDGEVFYCNGFALE